MQKDKNTEQLILEAAKKVFIRKGYDGARMQEIADEADINKSLLHYYFRSKDKLFNAVFSQAFSDFLPRLGELLVSDKPLKHKIRIIIESYIDLLTANPHLPLFLMHELARNPDMIIDLIKKHGINPDKLIQQIAEGVKQKKIKKVDPHHLIVNMLSMCIFPFAARPMVEGLLFKKNKKMYEKFLSERKDHITNYIIKLITT